ncbi:SH3 domain-containing protein [Pseudotabrizicola sediminis]|uniref:SH3 domain-containing protein n=1 Tax=Pseudotabrizicola sediminis TaxID=2486418 RepID=A0ABY2KL42_9RHOB|nr:SH3 domain-containing protein [Pseudotabrizicola sediminis]TGD41902.1 SH3 domain-containing protein [Pseudotabrizicola sediminis]
MRKALFGTIAAAMLATVSATTPAEADPLGRHEVYGVQGDDMLKMRAGPGVGYVVIVGLPNGAVVRVHRCEQSGSTRWCSVTLDRARGLKGYVSASYLRKL